MWIHLTDAEATEVMHLRGGHVILKTLKSKVDTAQQNSANLAPIREQAVHDYEDNDCDLEVDPDAAFSIADTGTWVMAWVWVRNEEKEPVCSAPSSEPSTPPTPSNSTP